MLSKILFFLILIPSFSYADSTCPKYSLPACSENKISYATDSNGCGMFICDLDSSLELKDILQEAYTCNVGQILTLTNDYGLVCSNPGTGAEICVTGLTAIRTKDHGHRCVIPK